MLKEGDNFFVVQPTTRKISRALGVEELTSTLQGVRSEVAAEGRLALSKSKIERLKSEIVSLGQRRVALQTDQKKIVIQTDDYTQNKNIFSRSGRSAGEVNARIKAIPEFENILKNSKYAGMDTDIRGIEKDAKKGVTAIHRFTGTWGDFATEAIVREKGNKFYLYEIKFMDKKSSQQSMTDESASSAPNGVVENDTIITENAEKSNSFAEKNSANDAKSDTSANLEGTTPPPQAVPRPSQGADGKSEQGAVQKSAQEADDGKARREAIAIDVWARENIPDYAGLNASARAAVRATVRNARAHGISNEEVLVYARVAARSGLSIAFDVAQAQAGDARYNMRNTIFVDPNAPAFRRRSKLLLHEGGHALFLRTKSGRKLMEQAFRLCDPETAKQVREDYTKYYEKQGLTKEQYEPIIEEEIAAAGLESALGVDGAWEFILSKRPTAGEKLLSFFRGAARDYAGVGELSAEARKLLRTYQKAFAELSARNQGNNALTGINGENVTKNGHNVLQSRQNVPENGQNVPQNGKTVTESGNNVIETKKAADDGGRLARKITPLTEGDLQEYLKAGGRQNKSKTEAIANGEKIILTTEEEIRSFINRAILGSKGMSTTAYGRVPDYLANDVRKISNGSIVVDNNFLEFVPDDLHHAYEGHTQAKKDGDIALTKEDFEKIPEYIESYDDIVYAMRFASGNTKICISKKIENGRVLLIQTVSKSRGSLNFKNMIGVSEEKYLTEYADKNKKRSSPNTRGSQSSNNSLRDGTASNVSIADSDLKSNTFSEKSFAISSTKSTKNGVGEGRLALPKDTKSQASGKTDANTAAHKSADTITMSKGQLAALQANYHGDKVFAKKDVAAALKGIDAFAKLPADIRNDFINRIWTGYNKRLHAQGFEMFTEITWHQLHATIMQEVGYDELGDMTEAQYADAERVMDEQIVSALNQIVASGKQSIKARLSGARAKGNAVLTWTSPPWSLPRGVSLKFDSHQGLYLDTGCLFCYT
ncbi:MAG: hypothetical protein E7624_00910 [Ruminococcaceae bacterium]|nr:hypothetical protein [Oscillospiraceae bacterium]